MARCMAGIETSAMRISEHRQAKTRGPGGGLSAAVKWLVKSGVACGHPGETGEEPIDRKILDGGLDRVVLKMPAAASSWRLT
jgi:hypothetical protein